MTALRKISHGLDCQSRQILKETGLTSAQLILLDAISQMSKTTTRNIAQAISLSPATVNVMVDRLVAKGLIERIRSTEDRRIVHSHLTSQGRKALKASPPLLPQTVRTALANMSKTDQDHMVEALFKFADLFSATPTNDTAAQETVSRPKVSEGVR